MLFDRRGFGNGFLGAVLALGYAALLSGCAATGGGTAQAPLPIPEGKGRLILETGGIYEVNFYVIDQETDEEVYSETPRLSASSPSGYERGVRNLPPHVDLPPGLYTVVVNTDIRDDVRIPDVEVVMGEERYVQVPIGRFQIFFWEQRGDSRERAQVPFLIYDYSMRTVLGKGMTSTEVRYFIAPVGNYKIRIENSPTGLDEIRPVQVSFGRAQNISIEPPTATTPGQGGGGGPQQ